MDPRFDPQQADAIVEAFARYAVHIKGPMAGQPAPLKPWQEAWLRQVFGTLDEDGRRVFHTVFILEPKKVGKTFVSAMLCLLLISLFGEYGAEVFSIANSREQASEVFKAARLLVELSPGLQELGFDPVRDVRPSTKTIYYRPLNAVYKALAADSDNLHGLGPFALVADELHAMKNRDAIDALREGMGIWQEHLTLYITNMGAADESPAFWEELDYAKGVAAGVISDPTYFAKITEAPAHLTDDELLEEGPHWFAINPALGDTIPVDFYRRACLEAKNKPSQRSNILRLHLCRAATSVDNAIQPHLWKACTDPTLSAEQYIGRECVIGIDLSSRWDLTSMTASFVEPDGGRTWFSWSWVPRDQIEAMEKMTNRPIRKWVEDPAVSLFACDGPTIRYDDLERFVAEFLAPSFDVAAYVYDPKFALHFAQRLSDAGYAMVEFVPSFRSYAEPWNSVEALILGATEGADGAAPRLRHNGDPVLAWAALGLQIKRDLDGGAKPMKPERRKSERRIDPVVAGIMSEAWWVRSRVHGTLDSGAISFGG